MIMDANTMLTGVVVAAAATALLYAVVRFFQSFWRTWRIVSWNQMLDRWPNSFSGSNYFDRIFRIESLMIRYTNSESRLTLLWARMLAWRLRPERHPQHFTLDYILPGDFRAVSEYRYRPEIGMCVLARLIGDSLVSELIVVLNPGGLPHVAFVMAPEETLEALGPAWDNLDEGPDEIKIGELSVDDTVEGIPAEESPAKIPNEP